MQIRIGVFETNSSSSHSLVISRGKMNLDTLKPVNGKIMSSGGEFGWENDTYYSPQKKLDYLVSFLFQNANSYEKVQEIKWKDKRFQMLSDVIYEHCGYKLEVCKNKDLEYSDWCPYGYIDHNSSDLPEKENLFSAKSVIAAFLFNPNSSITTGNDNE